MSPASIPYAPRTRKGPRHGTAARPPILLSVAARALSHDEAQHEKHGHDDEKDVGDALTIYDKYYQMLKVG